MVSLKEKLTLVSGVPSRQHMKSKALRPLFLVNAKFLHDITAIKNRTWLTYVITINSLYVLIPSRNPHFDIINIMTVGRKSEEFLRKTILQISLLRIRRNNFSVS